MHGFVMREFVSQQLAEDYTLVWIFHSTDFHPVARFFLQWLTAINFCALIISVVTDLKIL